ncbi:MAG: tRNA (adenosine(37)-N6)-threonylcarbamoyltransferase complex ATPase subunit type 1 TsaE [Planctomycetota bacterium]
MASQDSKTFELCDLNATADFAERLANQIPIPFTITLNGTLGAGKTQFVRFFAQQLGVPAEDVTSPTYVLLQRYVGRQKIYHFDFYRLDSSDQVWDLGIDEIFVEPAIVIVEWASKFPECLPEDYLELLLTTADGDSKGHRTLVATARGRTASETLLHLSNTST